LLSGHKTIFPEGLSTFSTSLTISSFLEGENCKVGENSKANREQRGVRALTAIVNACALTTTLMTLERGSSRNKGNLISLPESAGILRKSRGTLPISRKATCKNVRLPGEHIRVVHR
jgi:hypothetical protein